MTIEERAQAIRKKRLEEREAEQKQPTTEIQEKVNEMANWILDLLTNPGPYNTKDMVRFTSSGNGNIQLMGQIAGLETTDKSFEHEVMLRLEVLFKEQEGFDATYIPKGHNIVPTFRVKIE